MHPSSVFGPAASVPKQKAHREEGTNVGAGVGGSAAARDNPEPWILPSSLEPHCIVTYKGKDFAAAEGFGIQAVTSKAFLDVIGG